MNKFNEAYKTIGEVTKELGLIDKKTGRLQTHTIRYWETQFKQIKPTIRAGKRRYYSTKVFRFFFNIQVPTYPTTKPFASSSILNNFNWLNQYIFSNWKLGINVCFNYFSFSLLTSLLRITTINSRNYHSSLRTRSSIDKHFKCKFNYFLL